MNTVDNGANRDADLIHDWNTVQDFKPLRKGVEFDDESLRDGLQSPSVVDPPI